MCNLKKWLTGELAIKRKKTNNTNKKKRTKDLEGRSARSWNKRDRHKSSRVKSKSTKKKNLFLKLEANPAHSLTGNRKTRKKLKCKLCEN